MGFYLLKKKIQLLESTNAGVGGNYQPKKAHVTFYPNHKDSKPSITILLYRISHMFSD